MYARLTLAQIQPGQMEEVVQFIRDAVVPAAKQAPGFKGLLVLTDPSTNKGVALGLWESEADLLASEAPGGYYREEMAKGAHFFSAPPVLEVYEVSLQV
jgi:heme-degrading monooxygenase HmoA